MLMDHSIYQKLMVLALLLEKEEDTEKWLRVEFFIDKLSNV